MAPAGEEWLAIAPSERPSLVGARIRRGGHGWGALGGRKRGGAKGPRIKIPFASYRIRSHHQPRLQPN